MKKSFMVFSFFAGFMSFEIHAIATRFESNLPLFSWLTLKLRYDTDISGKVYAGAAATALVIKAAYDISWHNDYTAKANDTFRKFVNHIHLHSISSLKDKSLYSFFNQSANYDFCLTYESWLRNSYDSWLKPWNWTADQKAAYEKMEILSMMALHGPLIMLDEQTIEQELVKHARKHCSAVSEYPLIYYGELIDAHLVALKKGFSVKNKMIQNLLIELKQGIFELKYILRGNKAYIEECQTLKTHRLLEQATQNCY